MEKQYKKEDDFMELLLQEAGLEKPSSNFSSKVLQSIESKQNVTIVYEPLLTKKKVGFFIGLILLATLVAYFVVAPESLSINLFEDFSMNTSLIDFIEMPSFTLSSIVVYAVGFMALFFVQVPFLKHYFIEKV